MTAVLLAIGLLSIPHSADAQTPDVTGRWTPASSDWGHEQIHMALLRGDYVPNVPGTHHSKLISWGYHGPSHGGRLWGWSPGSTPADNDCSQYPSAHFTALTLNAGAVPDIFCSGHSSLADGNLLVTGGHDVVNNAGLAQSTIFRPNPASNETQWTAQPSMAQERWYPTNVSLPDGNVLTFSGDRFRQMVVFGGTEAPQNPTSATHDEINRLGFTTAGLWLSAITPSNRPQPRESHSAVWHPGIGEMIVFGGRSSGSTEKLDNTWLLRVNQLVDSYDYVWSQIFPSGVLPQKRDRHAAIVRNDGRMLVFGGRNNAGAALSDMHTLRRLIFPPNAWQWDGVSPMGSPNPGARYGHVAVSDPENNRMLVFGGRHNETDLADNEVYALSFATNTWSQLSLTGKPERREGHSWVADPILRDSPFDPDLSYNDRQFVLFGGKTTAGPQKDVWLLWVHGDGATPPRWQSKSLSGGPPELSRHSATWDESHLRMVVFGGATDTGANNTVWALDDNVTAWTQLATQPQYALAGQSAIYHPQIFKALDPELFTPGSPTGSWQPQNTPKYQDFYPFMLLAPSGNLFWAGPAGTTYRYRRTLPTPVWEVLGTSSVWGGSAVMYRPGEIMKCGDQADPPSKATQKIVLDANDGTTGWVTVDTMHMRRVYQNLTILPTGRVLVTGGRERPHGFLPESLSASVKQPEIWDPATGEWSGHDVLQSDPARRGYHSTALLLPDGRIISGGGEPDTNPHHRRATVFCPPYLFNPGGSLATRPTIYAWHDTVGYGTQFKIWTESPDSILSACLIRPGAVTHGFNQDARYIPLTFQIQQEPGYCPEIVATAPSNSNVAPPGDYLLFILKKNALDPSAPGVPAVAQWVRLRSGETSPITGFPPPGCAGGGCPMVDVHTERGWELENSILGRSLTGELLTDTYRMRGKPELQNGKYRLRIRENEQEFTALDQARFLAVDHAPGLNAQLTSQGVVLGERRAAYRVTGPRGEDVTHLLDGVGGPFYGRAGDTLLVDLDPPDLAGTFGLEADTGNDSGLLEEPCCEKQGPQPGGGFRATTLPGMIDENVLTRTGIVVQVRDAEGWRTIQHRYPREREDQTALDTFGQDQLRLIFRGRHRLAFVGRMLHRGTAEAEELPLVSATHSRARNVLSTIKSRGGGLATLENGDTLDLDFAARPVPPGMVRDVFLVTTGVYTSDPAKARATRLGAALPSRFALAQNQPNPFTKATRIHFELPVRSRARIEVFDLAGRRVRLLADQEYSAGSHSVEWDKTDGVGRRVRPGVYVYRLTAGVFQDQKKMTLLP